MLLFDKLFSWGCDHENQARERYSALIGKDHTNFKISQAGLFVDVNDPIVGATPDGMVTLIVVEMGF